jgi:hypothetical protein
MRKDPAANLDFTLAWSSWLGTDTITAVTWLVPDGLTKTAESHTTTTATIWLSGGSDGVRYPVVCRITTAAGRIDRRPLTIDIDER